MERRTMTHFLSKYWKYVNYWIRAFYLFSCMLSVSMLCSLIRTLATLRGQAVIVRLMAILCYGSRSMSVQSCHSVGNRTRDYWSVLSERELVLRSWYDDHSISYGTEWESKIPFDEIIENKNKANFWFKSITQNSKSTNNLFIIYETRDN